MELVDVLMIVKFTGIYGTAMVWNQVAQNHTWKSYMEFYLKHLNKPLKTILKLKLHNVLEKRRLSI
jgi:predicted phosphoadenosine phosphosulfate sulfurtransferase